MAQGPNYSNLLSWSTAPQTSRTIDANALNALLGGTSEADQMKDAMAIIQSPTHSMDDKLIAWDNFGLLIDSLDNANNLNPLGLWTPLIQQLENEDTTIRVIAADCVSRAVQNNEPSQERALASGALPRLLQMLHNQKDSGNKQKQKAMLAVRSLVRNYQPAMDALLHALSFPSTKQVDAADVEGFNEVMAELDKFGQAPQNRAGGENGDVNMGEQ